MVGELVFLLLLYVFFEQDEMGAAKAMTKKITAILTRTFITI
jgi:hypothetical protein